MADVKVINNEMFHNIISDLLKFYDKEIVERIEDMSECFLKDLDIDEEDEEEFKKFFNNFKELFNDMLKTSFTISKAELSKNIGDIIESNIEEYDDVVGDIA